MTDLIEQAITLGVGVGQISDAMDELGLPQNAAGGYRLLGGKGGTVFGRAFTLKQTLLKPGETGIVRQGEAALTLASPGDVLVIDAGNAGDVVTWGEGHSLRAQINGLKGVVLNGATRDSEALAAGPLPVLCRGTSPLRSKGRLQTLEIGAPVSIHSVQINVGDLIVFGADGLACIPKHDVKHVLEMACEIQTKEMQRDAGFRDQINRSEI
ncbi:RraA family protein [Agrobacterium sp. AGB01]|uniref:RraA family protein n=1 Tax=Agrobacterium sp. AGB01 TaxID=2769302 RepID=UPI00177CACE9|nr:RraA family protein [Agrobacterium sp. AGB01]MBD9388485.1 RraA family protein [Agrobacterium sp. AGB01]